MENGDQNKQQAGWNATASKDVSNGAKANFRPNYWVRGGIALVIAYLAYASFPMAWKNSGSQQSDIKAENIAQTLTSEAPVDPAQEIWVNAAKEAIAQYACFHQDQNINPQDKAATTDNWIFMFCKASKVLNKLVPIPHIKVRTAVLDVRRLLDL